MHSYMLINQVANHICQLVENAKQKLVTMEFGSDLGEGSTIWLAQFCQDNGLHFITVDPWDKPLEEARKTINTINPSFEGVCGKGEDVLSRYKSQDIVLVYLDAFDTYHTMHKPDKIESYESRGYKITDENAWTMHLDVCTLLKDKMVSGGIICFDDVYTGPPEWKGKGTTAIPYLLENGFICMGRSPKGAMFRKVL